MDHHGGRWDNIGCVVVLAELRGAVWIMVMRPARLALYNHGGSGNACPAAVNENLVEVEDGITEKRIRPC